jgi:hypothetical protein
VLLGKALQCDVLALIHGSFWVQLPSAWAFWSQTDDLKKKRCRGCFVSDRRRVLKPYCHGPLPVPVFAQNRRQRNEESDVSELLNRPCLHLPSADIGGENCVYHAQRPQRCGSTMALRPVLRHAHRSCLSAFVPRTARRFATAATDSVRVVEVGPRDGLQNEKNAIPVQTKIELVSRLAGTGLRTVEAGSFVSPKWTPQVRSPEAWNIELSTE